MANPKLVPVRVTPDDLDARRDGETAERLFRQEILSLVALCAAHPQPKWLFEDMSKGKPMSYSQIFRAFALVARQAEVPVERVHEAADNIVAMARSMRPAMEMTLEQLHVAETKAQGVLDDLQLQLTLTRGQCRATLERALPAIARQQALLGQYGERVASLVRDAHKQVPTRQTHRITRTRKLVAAKS